MASHFRGRSPRPSGPTTIPAACDIPAIYEMLIPVPRTCSLSYLPAVLRRYRPDLTLATVPYMNRLLETEM
jgi:hypothetical protein